VTSNLRIACGLLKRNSVTVPLTSTR
jgi:hypothetical protein